MARKVIDIGAVGNDGTGDSIRDSFRKVNDNFRELYSSLGLGEKLTFIGLDDTPQTYLGQNNAILSVGAEGIVFKQLREGTGISLNQENPTEITINSEFSRVSGDSNPSLGGNLSATSGGNQYRITDLTTPITGDEAVNKDYADSKVSLAGVEAIDPETGTINPVLGTMSGPLILSRDPVDDDDATYGGLIAATKNYVDNSGYGSKVNLYVSTDGQDYRTGVSDDLQGRSLASAYRTIEAALKRAEEVMLESKLEIGPYKKILTYNAGTKVAVLDKIEVSPDSGVGFAGTVLMSVDEISLVSGGTNYRVGDRLTLTGSGGAGDFAIIEVLSTVTNPGAITTFRLITNGVYSTLPGVSNVTTTTDSELGSGATFNATYKVNRVNISNGGSGYGLVSVRITENSGNNASGTASISSGEITDILITDQGSGFVTIPTLEVNLPRLFIRTEGFRTDFTGDVLTDTVEAIRGRDIREGLFLRGETSGALAQILAHEGALDSNGNEIFDVDVLSGIFSPGEPISYGDRARIEQISVFIEAGIYEENLPLRIPPNVAVIGDEFRRTLVRPKQGTSSSPWSFIKFRRDLEIDSLTTASQLFGRHYLHDVTEPVYPKISNAGKYFDSAELLTLNRRFLSNELVGWINDQISKNITPFSFSFDYDQTICARDAELLLNAMIFDLKYGEYNRTISAALKYYENESGRVAITTQLSETVAALNRLRVISKAVVANTEITQLYQNSFPQVVEPAFSAEANVNAVLDDLFDAVIDVIDGSGSVNYPEENDKLDVFLCNDTNIIRAITCQGHGGFMMVLDPTGQVLAKSPYSQECASFSKSIDAPTFAGGMFVDGFTGNLQFKHAATLNTGDTQIQVSGLERFPELPASFIVNDTVFRINYVRDFVYNKDGSTATFVLDETTPFDVLPGTQNCTVSTGNPAIITKSEHKLQAGATLIFTSTGNLPAGIEAGKEYYVLGAGLTASQFRITETFGSTTPVETTSSGTGTISYQRLYEVLMPGNRSMLSNDFTQVNDLGYGVVAHNGGLTEAVSMFTYYCHIAYYSLNGGQIRSVGGSSAHGNYALVAEGSDPLEIPTPTEVYYDFSQRVDCYFPSAAFTNDRAGLTIYVTNYEYEPMGGSELEIDHGNQVFKYPVTSVSTEGFPDGVVQLNLTSDDTGNFDGLFAQVPDGTRMVLRANSQIILTGGLEDVAVRPSTGLILNDQPDVYRVLQFDTYTDPVNEKRPVIVSATDPADISVTMQITTDGSTITQTTETPHNLRPGDKIKLPADVLGLGVTGDELFVVDVPSVTELVFDVTADGYGIPTTNPGTYTIIMPHELPEGLTVNFTATGILPGGFDLDQYFVSPDGLTDFTFRVTKTLGADGVEATTTGSGVTYSVIGLTKTTLRENYDYNDLPVSSPSDIAPNTETACGISIGSPAVISTGSPHGLNVGDAITFDVSTGGSLPTGLSLTLNYFVYQVLSPTTFSVSFRYPTLANVVPVDTSGSLVGTASYGLITGRGRRSISTTTNGGTTLSTVVAHDLDIGDKVRTTFDPGVTGLNTDFEYFVVDIPAFNLFEISLTEGGAALSIPADTIDLIIPGDDRVAVVPVDSAEESSIPGTVFMHKGEEYEITAYNNTSATGKAFATIELDRPLEDSVVQYDGTYTIKTAVKTRTTGAKGTLTIRISLTRVTSHDLLEIGTGSYADTNYPNEIYGASVNPVNEGNEYEERDVGRVFFVTTDQFGNFKVGPYFKVDQGTGNVTFASSIALSNLDGIGFKRGVPVSEFSVDTTLADNAIDTVPTENAVRSYIDKRLGLTHTGSVVPSDQLIPITSGGFMSLDGQLEMKANMPLAGFNIVQLGDPNSGQDAVNLRSLTIQNFQDFAVTEPRANDILVFTGNQDDIQHATVVGDISLDIDSTLNTIDAQINPGAILNSDVNSSAGIVQSKLSMNSATTRANATGITQAEKGLASFDSAQFDATSGWISVKNNGLVIEKIETILPKTVLGNEALTAGNVTEVAFTDVVDQGAAVKKSQFTGVGFLKRINPTTGDGDSDYDLIASSSAYTGAGDNSKIITRNTQGDFGARIGTLDTLKISEAGTAYNAVTIEQTASGGYVQIFAYEDEGGILLQNGTASDKVNQYRNDLHQFKTIDGNDDAPITCSEIETPSLTTGGQAVAGTVTGAWTLVGSSTFEATYAADLAEYYEGDKEYEPATVLVFGGEKEVTESNHYQDTRLAGVVSENAAYKMYGACPGYKNLVALQGRVPCKVIGKIQKGDMVTTSKIPGVATKAVKPELGTIIGKALTDYDSDEVGIIEIAVGRN